MADTGTDQTDITYVRPGTWNASAGIPGIDALHSFAEDPRLPLGPPEPSPGSIGQRGPSAVKETKAPPQNARAWWRARNRSNVNLDLVGNGPDWNVTLDEPQVDTQKAPDPRWRAQVAPRWTARTGPVGVAYFHRADTNGLTGARRFQETGGTNFAFTPSLRPSPMAMGDGIGTKRFRPTQRNSPAPLDQQIVSDDQANTRSGGVLSMGGTLSQRWW